MEAFGDGVFGFAVTLIILNIRVPHREIQRTTRRGARLARMRDNSTMIFAAFWLDNPKPNNRRSSTYEIRYRSGFKSSGL